MDKAQTLLVVALDLLGKNIGKGALHVTMTKTEVDKHGRLVVWATAKRNGKDLKLDLPFVYVNPPTAVRLADGTSRVDPVAALKEIVVDTVSRF